jgi:hypothetical protein
MLTRALVERHQPFSIVSQLFHRFGYQRPIAIGELRLESFVPLRVYHKIEFTSCQQADGGQAYNSTGGVPHAGSLATAP